MNMLVESPSVCALRPPPSMQVVWALFVIRVQVCSAPVRMLVGMQEDC